MSARMDITFTDAASIQEIDMSLLEQVENSADLWFAVMKLASRERNDARYQIRRAVAQLESADWSDAEHVADVASSVLAQLRAYLESVENDV